MEELKEEIKQIEDLWKIVYDNCVAAPSLYKPYLSSLSIDEVGSVVLITLEWMKSLDNNRKGRNTYVLSKAVMNTTLVSMIASLKKLANGDYNHFNQFVTYLNNLLIALFPITFLNPKDKSYANLSMDVAEELVKLKDLSEKMENQSKIYNEVISLKNETDEISTSIENIKNNIEDKEKNIIKLEENINNINENINEKIGELSPIIDNIKSFSKNIPSIEENNTNALKTLNSLIEEAKNIKVTLHELLPDATSAGLASAFYDKAKQLKRTKKYLMGGFIVSIIALSSVALYSFYHPVSSSQGWSDFLQRSLILFAPVWLGWFFARSYGHANRLQEKYEYKEAMSKAFQGYRKQMEEVNTNSDLARSLSELTLTVLAENPSDVFERNCWDETPFHSLASMIIKKFKFGNKKNEEQ